jgi:hypothetical protein
LIGFADSLFGVCAIHRRFRFAAEPPSFPNFCLNSERYRNRRQQKQTKVAPSALRCHRFLLFKVPTRRSRNAFLLSSTARRVIFGLFGGRICHLRHDNLSSSCHLRRFLHSLSRSVLLESGELDVTGGQARRFRPRPARNRRFWRHAITDRLRLTAKLSKICHRRPAPTAPTVVADCHFGGQPTDKLLAAIAMP